MKLKLVYTFFIILASVTAFGGTKCLSKRNAALSKTDTLHVMGSVKNHFYYYENSMRIDGSNFMLTNAKGIKERIMMFLYESKNRKRQSIILLKIQRKAALNKASKSVIDYIKQQNYRQLDLRTVERDLINATEKS